ncbi:bifunctional UDP-sugar hydrolase/5'-nucleotidase [Microbacterium sp. C7(2022)]|uniref:bifunctional metallophosphatase/5'-nucleotidase n=1 Tax=Microbacterium sp. C7(2022) TaxID=2992759 RepID=UPI00237BDB49|nr:5'-nucleotidase C-terminal domain-containing protein [Microbacterium sp. C7(2022)]MDE0546798.1 5'-nucleotidase C-terminal domain-containing protein [Microbacterium sp. C7(2022)]
MRRRTSAVVAGAAALALALGGVAPAQAAQPTDSGARGKGESKSAAGAKLPSAKPKSFELTILHVNDGESALLPTSSDPGAARFVADLKALQAEAIESALPPQASERAKRVQQQLKPRAAVTISSGDNYLSGPRLNASLNSPDGTFYDALLYEEGGFDAITIGNHEFDRGPDVLADFIEAAGDIPFVSANLDVSGEPRLAALADAGRIAGSTVVEKAGREIGIVGAIYEDLRSISSPRNVTTSDAAQAVQAEVDALTAEGIDIIILSSHLQSIDSDVELISEITGVDAAIAGGGVERLDPFPAAATDADGKSIPVVTTVGNYRDIGKLVLRFDQLGNVTDVVEEASALVPVALDGPRDSWTAENVEAPVEQYVAALAESVIAETDVWLDGANPPVRFRETNVGDLFTDAMREAARDRAAEYSVGQADIALLNSGGIRNNVQLAPGSDVTELTTFDIGAFFNLVSIAEIDGQKLKEVLEHSVSSLPAAGNGRFGQWSGVEFVYDPEAQAQVFEAPTTILTPGERIREAVVTRADGTRVTLVAGGEVVAPDETFWFVTNDFTFRGGDNYPLDDVPFTTLGVTYQAALADWVAEVGVITADNYPDLTIDNDTYRRFGPEGQFSIPSAP